MSFLLGRSLWTLWAAGISNLTAVARASTRKAASTGGGRLTAGLWCACVVDEVAELVTAGDAELVPLAPSSRRAPRSSERPGKTVR